MINKNETIAENINRSVAFTAFLNQHVPDRTEITPLPGDAGCRRYSRIATPGRSLILMDAPPEQLSLLPFFQIAKALSSMGMRVPSMHAVDCDQGWILLEDFGDNTLLTTLTAENVDAWMRQALLAILPLNSVSALNDLELPVYTPVKMEEEWQWFLTWALEYHARYRLARHEIDTLMSMGAALIESIQTQPTGCVHRDFHSRNLMCLDSGELGIIDFQDAVLGPITYDLMSLVNDCYIDWPAAKVIEWQQYYHQALKERGVLGDVAFSRFQQWCDEVVLHRHVKNLGVFTRLCYRDQKPGYLQYLPRVVGYIRKICDRNPSYQPLLTWVNLV